MNIRKTTAGILGAGTLIMGSLDAAVLKEQPLQRVEMIAEERVEARQIDNRIETSFPWKDQEGLKVVAELGEPTISERLRDKRKKEVVTELVDFGEGGFKVDILLNEKPDTNRFCYMIEGAENYDFFYQPPLHEEYPDAPSCSATECDTDQDGEIDTYRPDDIVGSYAVYHKKLKNHQVGGENYATGKVMHIPRPEVWSLTTPEEREWAELSYEEGELCVTVRQGFLDEAEYPVRVDPTFGYTSVGGSLATFFSTSILASSHSLPTPGNVTSITTYTRLLSGTGSLGTAIYNDNSGEPGTLLVQDSGNAAVTNTASWRDTNVTVNLPAGTYHLAHWASTNIYYVYYDTGGTNILSIRDSQTFESWPISFSRSSYFEPRSVSIYATYTADEPPASAIVEDVIFFD